MVKLEICPFCGGNKVSLLYFNGDERETYCIDTDEDLDSNSIYAYVHCYECDIDFFFDGTPREVMDRWNNRVK